MSKAIERGKAAAKAAKNLPKEDPPSPVKYRGSPPADLLAAMPARARRHGVKVRRRSATYAKHLNKIAEIAKKRRA